MSKALEALALRILEPNGNSATTFEKLAGLKAVTDELLMVASDAVEAAVAASATPELSGRKKSRVLARLVAAGMGSPVVFEDAAAEGHGRRLDQQVKMVRKALGAAVAKAEQERTEARDAAAADALLVAGLPGLLAEIGRVEREALAAPATEKYNNFWQIEESAAQVDAPAAGVQVDELTVLVHEAPLNIPEDVANQLGDEGCRELRQACRRQADFEGRPVGSIGVDDVLTIHIPGLVENLLRARASQAMEMTFMESRLERVEHNSEELSDRLCSARDELIELSSELLVANTQVSTLQGVIRNHVCREAK